jgi:hypothetical protein
MGGIDNKATKVFLNGLLFVEHDVEGTSEKGSLTAWSRLAHTARPFTSRNRISDRGDLDDWIESESNEHEAGSTGATGLAGGRATGLARTGGTGSPFASGASATASATSGTVTDIIGDTLYVTESSGSLVKVTLSSTATVTRNAKSSLGALKPGDTVVVQGTKVSGGAMTASSVSATAAGVISATASGGFGVGANRSSAQS